MNAGNAVVNVVLNAELQGRIIAQMEASYPNEGGGFLLGTVDGDSMSIADIIPIDNVFPVEEQYHRYQMTPQDWARYEDEAEERGLSLAGYYHSHPDSPAIPSVYDRDHALPYFTYIITSVRQGRAAEMRVWRLQPDRTGFTESKLTVKPSEIEQAGGVEANH